MCPAGRAPCAGCGHFVTCDCFAGSPVGRKPEGYSACLPPGGGGMVMSRFFTVPRPRVASDGVIWDSLPTTTMASLLVSMYLFATRETSAEVTFSMPVLYFSRVSTG